MSVLYEASPEKVAGLMTDHIEDILQREIAHIMEARMKEIVKEASSTIARNLRGTVQGMRNHRDDEIVFLLKIDGVDTDIAGGLDGERAKLRRGK